MLDLYISLWACQDRTHRNVTGGCWSSSHLPFATVQWEALWCDRSCLCWRHSIVKHVKAQFLISNEVWTNIKTGSPSVTGSPYILGPIYEKEQDDVSMDREEVIQSRIAELEAELAQRRRYGRDTYEDGTVLSWEKAYEDVEETYRYAAVKAGTVWYVTGSKASSVRYTWDKLIQLWVSGIPVETVRRVAAWADIATPKKPEVVATWEMIPEKENEK